MAALNGLSSPGIGIDMFEIARMERALTQKGFIQRVFSDDERAYCDKRARPAEHYAARFAAREAVVKALGCGFSQGVTVRDISVRIDGKGRPQAVVSEQLQQCLNDMGVCEIALSLSHTRDYAIANALLVTDAMRPKVEQQSTQEQQLVKSFKKARVILDELDS